MNIIAIIMTVLSVVSALFYLIGVMGASDDKDTIEDVNWANGVLEFAGKDFDFYFGLKAFTVDGDVEKYDDCDSDICGDCGDAGETTTAMVAIALICAIITSVIGVLSIFGKGNKIVSIAGIVASACSIIFGVIGFVVFDECYSALDDDVDDVEYGPGMALTLVAFLMMLVVTGLFIFDFIKGGSVSPA